MEFGAVKETENIDCYTRFFKTNLVWKYITLPQYYYYSSQPTILAHFVKKKKLSWHHYKIISNYVFLSLINVQVGVKNYTNNQSRITVVNDFSNNLEKI